MFRTAIVAFLLSGLVTTAWAGPACPRSSTWNNARKACRQEVSAEGQGGGSRQKAVCRIGVIAATMTCSRCKKSVSPSLTTNTQKCRSPGVSTISSSPASDRRREELRCAVCPMPARRVRSTTSRAVNEPVSQHAGGTDNSSDRLGGQYRPHGTSSSPGQKESSRAPTKCSSGTASSLGESALPSRNFLFGRSGILVFDGQTFWKRQGPSA